MEKVLNIKDLSFSYGSTEVLKNLSFTIEDGDFVGILGNNGSGKSTLLKILVSELKGYTGKVELFGEDICNFKDWKKIGYVPQIDMSKSIAFPISVREMISLNLYREFGFFKHPNKTHWQRIDEIMKMFDIYQLKDRSFNDLSGGQKQRVMIAKAMVHNPVFLIFDEPTVGIDEDSKREFFKILDHINKNHGITIVMVTHELDMAEDYFTRKIFIRDKKAYV
ncbi:MAG: ABC transporter ATP-binding protein [Tissierellia bacterium]|nr:ABC transporter ATP-binding protein [Tissierellia bacterium]